MLFSVFTFVSLKKSKKNNMKTKKSENKIKSVKNIDQLLEVLEKKAEVKEETHDGIGSRTTSGWRFYLYYSESKI